MIPIYTPYLNKYKTSAINAINSEWVSNYGIFVKNAEEKIKELFNIPYCILTNNGTAAGHCMLLAIKFKRVSPIFIPSIKILCSRKNAC